MTTPRKGLCRRLRDGDTLLAHGAGPRRTWGLLSGAPVDPATAEALLRLPFRGGRLRPCPAPLPAGDRAQAWRWSPGTRTASPETSTETGGNSGDAPMRLYAGAVTAPAPRHGLRGGRADG